MKYSFLLFLIILFSLSFIESIKIQAQNTHHLKVRAIDTMKYSRDVAREKLKDPSFDAVIDEQVRNISGLGATHVAIATPYDAEFLPIMKRWVAAARKHNLKVWFRGNFSGWEEWFEYPPMSRRTHLRRTEQFILTNKDLFEDGDIFTSCPECENGGPGDPRFGDLEGFRKFLIDEYTITKKAFEKIDKDVTANYYSMNGDVARLAMDKETTKALDGIVTIDHYVKDHDRLVKDIADIAKESGGKIVLGEIGAPIPDIHGDMTQLEQAQWMAEGFAGIDTMPQVVGVNYWVNLGGSTQLWDDNGKEKLIAQVIKNYYLKRVQHGKVVSVTGRPIQNATITAFGKTVKSDNNGTYTLPFFYAGQKVTVKAVDYKTSITTIENGRPVIALEPIDKPQEQIIKKIMRFIFLPLQFIDSLLTM